MLDKVFIDGLSFAAPLLVMAIGAIYSEKSGVTNLAVEGFQGFGAFVGALVAVLLMPTMGDGSQAVDLYCHAGGLHWRRHLRLHSRSAVREVPRQPGHQWRGGQYFGGCADHLSHNRDE